MDSGQAGIPDLAAMLDGYEYVDARMALIRATDGWQVGLKVMAPAPVSSCMFQRLPGQAEWSHLTTPWPRTEWSISPRGSVQLVPLQNSLRSNLPVRRRKVLGGVISEYYQSR